MMIRYAGYYSGPSYGTYDYRDGLEGFTSLKEAQEKYESRLNTSGSYPLHVLRLTVEDSVITGTSVEHVCFPATTKEDIMDLYRVYEDQVADEPFARLTAGPRDGVVMERY